MAVKYVIDDETMTAIAEPLRSLSGRTDELTPGEMATAGNDAVSVVDEQTDLMEQIQTALTDKAAGGITPAGTVTINENGTHDVTNYARAEVNVPSKEPVLQEKTVTENGTVTPDNGYDGLSKVVVNVAASGGEDAAEDILNRNITSYSSDALTSLGNYAFCQCEKLLSVNLPNVTTLGESALNRCEKLKSIHLPKVASIKTYGMSRCKALTTADFPVLTSIATYAFQICSGLTALILRSETVCTLSSTNALGSTPIESGTGYIYVPSSLLSTYQAATNWSTYAAQFRALESYTVDGTTTGALDESRI